MDRLPAVIAAAALACAACDKDSAAPPPSRTESAKGGAKKAANTDAFCDVHNPGDSGPMFELPPLVAGTAPAATPGHWRWVNLWATWCKPCVEEMPRLVKWQKQLAAAHPIDLAFLSVDKAEADVAAFRGQHADAPESVVLGELEKQTAWLGKLGIDSGAPIPIHIFVTPTGHVRCTRAGGVREQDRAAVEQLLAE